MRGSSQKLQFQWLGAPLLVGLALCLAVLGYRWRATELPPVVVEAEERETVERAEWFYEQRAYPLTAILSGARWHAVEQLEQEEIQLRQFRAARTAASLPTGTLANTQPGWQPLGPAPIGQGQTFGTPRVSVAGRVSALALAPGYNGTTNQTVYLGPAQGGVWRSRDNGATWTPLTDDQPSQVIGALALDPANANVIYTGTGEGNPLSCSSYYGAGLLKSTDGGATWAQIPGPASAFATTPAFVNAGIARIAIDPVASSTIYLCTTVGRTNSASAACTQAALLQRGAWKSTDGGASWQNLDPSNSGGSTQATDLVIDPLNHDRVFTALLNQGIYRSTGGGELGTWQKLTNGLTANGFQPIALASGPPLANAANITLYAAFSAVASRNLLGIYKSTDGGANWNQATTPQLPGQADYNLALAVDPADANIVYYGTSTNSQLTGGTFWKSTNGGQGWTDQSRFLHPDTHVIAISLANRNIIFTGNDGGGWRTENALAATVSPKPVAPETIVAAFGTRLAGQTVVNTPGQALPTTLDGTIAYVNGVPASLFFVFANQINFLLPEGTTNTFTGAANLVVVARDGTVSQGQVPIATVAPGLFTSTANGTSAPAAVASTDGGATFPVLLANTDGTPVEIQAGNVVALFGTGLRFKSGAVTATAGGVTSTPLFVGAQGGLAGLDQINWIVPQELTGKGELDLTFTLDGKTTNPVKIKVR